ncbi:MAG: D-alanine--D-alanine ligase, partial [Spirochaetia bacterium]|nr:D-alanine--D-alanine ligase [Spirochaetia bacterium]
SVGVKLVKDLASLKSELETLEKNGQLSGYFAERFLAGREVTVGIFRERGELRILPILELKPKNDFYDYDAKYTAGKTEMILPAPLSKATQTSLEHLARKVFQTFGFRNCIRIDIIIHDDIPYILEINTQPGMTETSDIPAMLASAGIPVAAFLAANLENAKSLK